MISKQLEIDGRWIDSPSGFFIEQHLADTMNSAHWHDHIEINLLLEGSMTYLFNGRQEHVEAGHLVLFWAAIPHQTIFVSAEAPLVCIYLPLVDFLALPIEASARQAILQGSFIHDVNCEFAAPALGTNWIKDWNSGNNARKQLVMDDVCLRVRRLILDHLDHTNTEGEMPPLKSPAIRYAQILTELITIRYAEPWTLRSIAKVANVHPTTANRAFHEVLGISVMEYLTRYRLARAMQKLAETEDAILDIVIACGFGSMARFYDLFKKRTNTTPRQFRIATRSRQ